VVNQRSFGALDISSETLNLKLGELPLVHVVAVYEVSPWEVLAAPGQQHLVGSDNRCQFVPLVFVASTSIPGCKKSMSAQHLKQQRLVAAQGACEILCDHLPQSGLASVVTEALNLPQAIARELALAPRMLGQFGERSKWLLQRVAREWIVVVDPLRYPQPQAL